MTVTGTVFKGHAPTSGQLIYLKTDVAGAPTDAEFTTLLLVFENNGLLTFTNGAANIAYTATVTGAPIAAPFSGTIIAQGASVCDSFYQIPIDLTTDTNHQFNAIDVELTAESGTSTS